MKAEAKQKRQKSFASPAKTITTAEGGLLTCADDELGARLARIRSSGITRDFEGARGSFDFRVTDLGSNYHLSELHAAMGLAQLDRLDDLFDSITRVIVVACGTAAYAGMGGKYAIEQWARVPADVELAHEFRYRDPVIGALKADDIPKEIAKVKAAKRTKAKPKKQKKNMEEGEKDEAEDLEHVVPEDMKPISKQMLK